MIIIKERIIEDFGLTDKQFDRLQSAIDEVSHSYKDIKRVGEPKARHFLWEQALDFLANGKSFIYIITVVESSRIPH